MGMENASSSSTVQWKYDVFISFRGEDTRNNFMDYLYNALIVKGINTFRDDEKLERGKLISLELLKAIEESRVTVVILSKDYASSPWCLDELAKIIACKEDMGMIVLPVFHYVEPSDVRKQMGTFAQAFVKHEEKEEKTRVDKWRNALSQVGNLAGWHLNNTRRLSHVKEETSYMCYVSYVAYFWCQEVTDLAMLSADNGTDLPLLRAKKGQLFKLAVKIPLIID